MGEGLIQEARKLGVLEPPLIAATEGFGHDRKLHSAHFFELADQAIEITLAISETDAQRLFDKLREEKINIFYVKVPIELGMTGA